MMNENVVNGSSQPATIASSSRAPVAPALAMTEKPRKFIGTDFKRCQQKMFFYLTTLSLQRYIKEDASNVPEGTPDMDKFVVLEAWTHSNFLCKNYMLNGLEDSLYSVFSVCKTSKELWYALEKKYKLKTLDLRNSLPQNF